MPVTLERHGPAALILIDSPPVNALSQDVRDALADAVAAFIADPALQYGVLAAAGRTFVAGADIREFDGPPQFPATRDVAAAIEASPKPVVAALHGTPLGGGLELALGCHARVITPDAKTGFPEVTLGIIPGAGGTQRTPRLAGVMPALELVTTGKRISASEALSLGLVDEIAEDVREAAFRLAAALAERGSFRRAGELSIPPFDAAALDAAIAAVAKRAKRLIAPRRAAEAVRIATEKDFAEAMAREAEITLELRHSPQARALRHLFLAERRAGRPPAGAVARQLERIGVVGGGTMGAGIAVALITADFSVTLLESDAAASTRAEQRIRGILDRQLSSGRLTEQAHGRRLARLSFSLDAQSLAGADLIIEAIVEDMQAKLGVFKTLAAVAPNAVLASNTSYLDGEKLALETPSPKRVLGLHFFAPAHVMRLLEVISTTATAPDILATGLALGRRLGKISVVAGVCDGFIGNRIYSRWRQQCEFCLEDGALPEEVDVAMVAYGFPMGPFAVADMSGLDIAWAARRRRAATRQKAERYVPVADWLCEQGRFGQKTKAGWYAHDNGTSRPDPIVTALVKQASAARGVLRVPIAPEVIQARVHAAMVNEAARVLEEGIAARPSDIDLVLVNGYGYPAWRGGPMHQADAIGLPEILRQVEQNHAAGGVGWEPAVLLQSLVRDGRKFHDLNGER
jgi:3-hydroxyacyl-CoA dehydrogenase